MADFLTTKQVAKKLNIKPHAVTRLCREGEIDASHPGRKWLIPKESLDEYLKVRR